MTNTIYNRNLLFFTVYATEQTSMSNSLNAIEWQPRAIIINKKRKCFTCNYSQKYDFNSSDLRVWLDSTLRCLENMRLLTVAWTGSNIPSPSCEGFPTAVTERGAQRSASQTAKECHARGHRHVVPFVVRFTSVSVARLRCPNAWALLPPTVKINSNWGEIRKFQVLL